MSAARSSRYDLHLPAWYRARGERRWHAGTTESISGSGALIRTRERTHPTGIINIVIELPHEEDNAKSGCLTGTGRVVSYERSLGPDDSASFAIAVRRYRVQRSNRISLRQT
jgi:hypothetical protein